MLCIFFIHFSYSFFSFLWRRLSNTITPYILAKCDRILNIFYTNNYVLYLSEILLTIGMKKIVIRGKIKSLLFSCLLKRTSISFLKWYLVWNKVIKVWTKIMKSYYVRLIFRRFFFFQKLCYLIRTLRQWFHWWCVIANYYTLRKRGITWRHCRYPKQCISRSNLCHRRRGNGFFQK